LYRKLPSGPSQMSKHEVTLNQRRRMHGAMIAAVHSRGYPRSTVADVIALAGVSRRTFYEQFSGKDDCLNATHDAVVSHALTATTSAWRQQDGLSNQLHAACRKLLDKAAVHPEGARFVLATSLTAPGASRRARTSSLAFERPLHSALTTSPARPLIPAAAVVGAIRHVMFAQIRERGALSPRLSHQIVDWVDSYRPTSVGDTAGMRFARARAFNSRTTPPGTPASVPAPVRARVAEATVELVQEVGYRNVTDSDIARRAQISTKAFHKLYEDRDACVLSIRRQQIDLAYAAMAIQMHRADDWSSGTRLAIDALLNELAREPALTRLALVDFLEAGSVALDEMKGPIDELAEQLTASAPRQRGLPAITPQLIAAAIWATAISHATGGTLERLPACGPSLAYTAMAPYLGATEALNVASKQTLPPKREPPEAKATRRQSTRRYLPRTRDRATTQGLSTTAPGRT
jgi:AcrR family transcriptional regulator